MSKPALDVKIYLLLIKQKLDKLTSEAIFYILVTLLLEIIVKSRSQQKKQTKTSFEIAIRKFELQIGQSI